MQISSGTSRGTVKVYVTGDINYDSAGYFAETLIGIIPRKKPRLEVDLSECNFMCSNALGTLAAALTIARSRGGDLKLARVSENVYRLLEITNLKAIIHIKGEKKKV